ncbi:9232_t:CDS:1, partial [Funneliformis geosporum]
SIDSVYDDNVTLCYEQQSSSSSKRPKQIPKELPKKSSTIETPLSSDLCILY